MSASPTTSSPSGPPGPCPAGGTGPPLTSNPSLLSQACVFAMASIAVADAAGARATHDLPASTPPAVGADSLKDAMLQLKRRPSGNSNSQWRPSRGPSVDLLAEQLWASSFSAATPVGPMACGGAGSAARPHPLVVDIRLPATRIATQPLRSLLASDRGRRMRRVFQTPAPGTSGVH